MISNNSQSNNTVLVQHTAYINGLTAIQQAYEHCGQGSPSILTVLGPSRSGKSTLVKRFMSLHNSERRASGIHAPILYFRTHSRPTEKGMAFSILEALQDEFCYGKKVSEIAMTARAAKLIKKCGVKAIIIDETQHFTERWNQAVVNQAADWIKNLAEETNILLILVGTNEAIGMFEYNKQLQRRVLEHIQLPQFEWADEISRREFRGVLKGFQNAMSGFSMPNIYSDPVAEGFWIATLGLTGLIAKLMDKTSRNVTDRLNRLKDKLDKEIDVAEKTKVQAAIDDLTFLKPDGTSGAIISLLDFETAFDAVKGTEHNGIQNPFSVILGRDSAITIPASELKYASMSEPKSRGFQKRELAGVFHA